MSKDSAIVLGHSFSYIEGISYTEEYVMYEIPVDEEKVIIVPKRDYADFIYMNTEYGFGSVTDDMRGELTFSSLQENGTMSEAVFQIFSTEAVFNEPDFTLPAELTSIGRSAFEGATAKVVYIPDTCTNIGAHAFRNSAVTQIRIPENCSIADTAFDGCKDVQIFGTAGSAAEAFCGTHNNCTFITE